MRFVSMYMKYILIMIAVVLVVGCEQEVQMGTVVASVNGENLTLETLKYVYSEDVWNGKTIEEQREIINQWIELTVLSRHANNDDDLKGSVNLRFRAENARKRIYANALIANELQKLNISHEEMYNYYRLRQSDFIEPIREFNVQRIFFRNEEDMIRVNDMITNREIEYTPAALRYSQEGIGRNGGHMSTLVTRTGPDSLMWRALNDMDRFHRVTMPYSNGWIIARWGDYRMATGNRSFFDVRDEIEQILRNERQAEVFERILREARTMAQITIEY